MKSLARTIEDRIERKGRQGRTVRIATPQVLFFQNNTGRIVAPGESPSRFDWRCDYFSESKYAQSGVNTAVGEDSITVDNGDTGVAGVFSGEDFTYTDGTKAWTIDEWIGYHLVVNSNYYEILSNTATVLTLKLLRGAVIQNTSYSIVPFVPNSLVGMLINPDTSAEETYVIESNTETVITMEGRSLIVRGRNLVTTGDASAPYDTFRCSGLTGYADNFWVGNTIRMNRGANAGESRVVSSYTGATGEFVVSSGYTNAIDVSIRFTVLKPLLDVSVGATWRFETGYTPGADDFESNVGDLLRREIGLVGDGGIDDSNFDRPFVGRYAAEILSESTKSFSVDLEFNGAINIEMVEMSSNRRTIIRRATSPAGLPKPQSIIFSVQAFTWYRIEIYLYIPDTIQGKLKISSIVPFINSWRDITAGAPTVLDISGADSSSVSDPDTMEDGQITISWNNNTFLLRGRTDVYASDAEDGTYEKVGSVPIETTSLSVAYPPGTTKWFMLQHVSASGVLSESSAARKGIVAAAGVGNTVVTLDWVDNADTVVYPNENGWFNDAILKARITVSTDLIISAIKFTRSGAGQVDLGASSPATSAAVDEVAAGVASVIIEFTNGMATESQSWNYQYDKTAPTVLVITNDTARVANFGISIPVASGGVDALSGLNRREWYWSESSTDPVAATDPLREEIGTSFLLAQTNYDFDTTALYIWARAVDNAGNKSAWTQYNGASGFVNLSTREVTAAQEVRDIFEFSRVP